MPPSVTRLGPGSYQVRINGSDYALANEANAYWVARDATNKPVAEGHTKKEVLSRLTAVARLPQDREVSDTLKLFRRSLIEKGTRLSIDGIRGKCSFVAYTHKDDGSEWIDIVTPQLQRRTVRPDRIKRVHRH